MKVCTVTQNPGANAVVVTKTLVILTRKKRLVLENVTKCGDIKQKKGNRIDKVAKFLYTYYISLAD